ncbi:hypothetical protein Vadar_002372 [Vaccinium darrowii]|uniref:Uncharacterized protein n=1 Tax=Vaccinium darrowii TaxID=229202 RepID=A0ACB7XXR7_9ERIC|nr:hypothetical protein Vadar_002372 [Vaccinium darrowii]
MQSSLSRTMFGVERRSRQAAIAIPAEPTATETRRGKVEERERAPAGKRSRPETPLLSWKFHGGEKCRNVECKEERSPPPKVGRSSGRKLSARELAAVLWRMHLPEAFVDTGSGGERSR